MKKIITLLLIYLIELHIYNFNTRSYYPLYTYVILSVVLRFAEFEVSAPYSLLDIKVMAVSRMEAGRHQQHDESGLCRYIDVRLSLIHI